MNAGWLPKDQPGRYLYIRPTVIGNGTQLGVQAPKEALLFIIAVPWPDMSSNPSGLKLLASTPDTIRAWPGGFGYAKLGANYGPSLAAHGVATGQGFDQVLWLFGEERLVTEAGASNFFIVWEGKDGKRELVTASLESQVILPGVTRRSVLELARERLSSHSATGLPPVDVVERPFTIGEVEEAWKEGRIIEAFVSGTAVRLPLTLFSLKDDANRTVLHRPRANHPQRRRRHEHARSRCRARRIRRTDQVVAGCYYVRQGGA